MNYFEQLADQQMPKAVKRRAERAAAAPSPAEKKQQDQSKQFRVWKAWRREKRANVFDRVPELRDMLEKLSPENASDLVSFFLARDWSAVDTGLKHDALAAVGDAIVRMRIRQGMPPIDDSLPGEAPTAFEVIRKILTGVGHHEVAS